jgi:hypothetical protein
MCVIGVVVVVAHEHEDLERFGRPECNSLCSLFGVIMCVCVS